MGDTVQMRSRADLNGTAYDGGFGHRVSLEDLMAELSFFRNYETGAVSLVHRSGSYVRFEANGDLEVHASKSLRPSAERYLFLNDATTDEEADRLTLDRVKTGEASVIRDILENGRCSHLKEQVRRLIGG